MLFARLRAEYVDTLLKHAAEEGKPLGGNSDRMGRVKMPIIGMHHRGGDDLRRPGVLPEGKTNVVLKNETLDLQRGDLSVGLDVPAAIEAEFAVHDQRVLQPDLRFLVDAFNSYFLV